MGVGGASDRVSISDSPAGAAPLAAMDREANAAGRWTLTRLLLLLLERLWLPTAAALLSVSTNSTLLPGTSVNSTSFLAAISCNPLNRAVMAGSPQIDFARPPEGSKKGADAAETKFDDIYSRSKTSCDRRTPQNQAVAA